MVFDIKIKAPKLPRSLRGNVSRGIFNQEMRLGVGRGSTQMLRAARKAIPSVTGKTAKGWERITVRRRGNTIRGGIINRDPTAIVAHVLEKGTRRNPFPPVGGTGQEPALAEWIRRSGVNFTVKDKAGAAPRSANLGNLRDLKKLAFVIGRRIKRRGLPRPGVKAKIFTRALKQALPKVRAEMKKVVTRIVRKFG